MNSRHHIYLLLLLTGLLALPMKGEAVSLFSKEKTPVVTPAQQRREIIEQIYDGQNRIRALQESLRDMDKREALEEADGKGNPTIDNWREIDLSHPDPGHIGVYTYIFFASGRGVQANQESIDELLMLLDELPPSSSPAAISSRFLLPVEQQRSAVILARRPYDFKLARYCLSYLGLNNLPPGPVLVSLDEPLDPAGSEVTPPFLAVAFGDRDLKQSRSMLRVWHSYEQSPLLSTGHPLAELFWQLLDGVGPSRTFRSGGRLLIDLSSDSSAAPPQQP